MDINDFIQKFAEQFDETEVEILSPETKFHDMDEWSSLTALSIIAMVDEEYDVNLTGEDIRNSKSIKGLFEIVSSRLLNS